MDTLIEFGRVSDKTQGSFFRGKNWDGSCFVVDGQLVKGFSDPDPNAPPYTPC